MADKQEEASLVIHALQEPLVEALKETDTQDVIQNEELSWPTFVFVGIYFFIAGQKSGRQLITHLAHADPALGLPRDLKKSTFFDGFRRFRRSRHTNSSSTYYHDSPSFPLLKWLLWGSCALSMAAIGLLCGR